MEFFEFLQIISFFVKIPLVTSVVQGFGFLKSLIPHIEIFTEFFSTFFNAFFSTNEDISWNYRQIIIFSLVKLCTILYLILEIYMFVNVIFYKKFSLKFKLIFVMSILPISALTHLLITNIIDQMILFLIGIIFNIIYVIRLYFIINKLENFDSTYKQKDHIL